METVDIAVIGGGIAGISAAYHLATALPDQSVRVFEAEATLTHHSTGRSAAVWIENYGPMAVRPLTRASRSFFNGGAADDVDGEPLLGAKGYVATANESQLDELDGHLAAGGDTVRRVDVDEAVALAPLLRADSFVAAAYEPAASTIDVGRTHQAFVRGFTRAGGSIATTNRVDAATRQGDGWIVETVDGRVGAGTIVNASGAWGDRVAATAGVAPVGLTPRRRTAFMVDSRWSDSAHWPMTADVSHNWYANADGPQFLCSPADETPSEPCDAKPEEIDIAIAIDRINAATHLDIRSVRSSWAGLRTFSPDEALVIGSDPTVPSFLWFVGQGGFGIQTSPGAGRLLSDLVARGEPSAQWSDFALDLEALLPDRYRT